MGTSGYAAGPARLTDPTLLRVRAVVAAGLAALERRAAEVNALDVSSGADGDTGDNMVLTLRAVLDELDRLAGAPGGCTLDELGRDEIVASVARAALLGARGSSGVILSQLIRGAAEELASRPGELIDPALIGAALARASDQAYGSIREPAEGTMLSVSREMAHHVARELAHRPDARLAPESPPLAQELAIAAILEAAVDAGEASVARSPDRLRALREAGVVDAGGYGLVVLLGGILSALGADTSGETAAGPDSPARAPRAHVSDTHRWCVSFVVSGDKLDARGFAASLEAIGDAVLVVGDRATLRVHVHTDDPDAVLALFAGAGEISHREVVDMSAAAGSGSGSGSAFA